MNLRDCTRGWREPNSSQVEEVREEPLPLTCGHGFRVKLNAVHGEASVAEGHDFTPNRPVVGPGDDLQLAGNAFGSNQEGVISHRFQGRRYVPKKLMAGMTYPGGLSVHEPVSH